MYLDTSFIAPRYLAEATSDTVDAFLTGLTAGRLAISEWTTVEFASLLARRVRMNDLGRDLAGEIFSRFKGDMATSALKLRIVDFDLTTAASLILDDPMLGLRAADAVHLSVAQRTGSTLCTLDHVLWRACIAWGVEAFDLGLSEQG